MLVSGGETRKRGGKRAGGLTAGPRWAPRWLRREREDRELERWAAELAWQWSEAMEGAGLTRHTRTAARIPLTLVPELHSVDLGPPVILLVEMLPGQVAEDFQAQAYRIAETLGVPMVDIAPYDPGWIKVALRDGDSRT